LSAQPRKAMALVAVLAVVSLLAILAVATLSVTSGLGQGSALAVRDTRLDTEASYALATLLLEWRERAFSRMQIGATSEPSFSIPASPDTISATITRTSPEVFWLVAEATAPDGSRRRANIIARLVVPQTDTVPAIVAGGDVTLSHAFSVVPDTGPSCLPSAAALRLGASASLTSANGALPSLSVDRSSSVDTSRFWEVGGVAVTDLTRSADAVLPAGTATTAPTGIVHGAGDLTLTGGSGQGVLVVEGRLMLTGPVSFVGVIVAKGGLTATAAGSELVGLLRAGPIGSGLQAVTIGQPFVLRPSACAAEAALASAIVARPVASRAWAEMY
jgi:hypothetical protein